MKIDLHCHTKKVKQGDAITRNVTKELFSQKVIESDVKIIAITNHNHFDLNQYEEFSASVKDFCDIWPGVELDIACSDDLCKRGHLIVIANPKNSTLFSECVNSLVGNKNPDDFLTDIKTVFEQLDRCDCIYIPHCHKEPHISEKDIDDLTNMLEEPTRLFRETSDYRSLGVYSNYDYSVIIGSDVQDWNCYEKSKFADIRLPIHTFQQFCLLAKKDATIIDTLLNKKKKRVFNVSPYEGVSFDLNFYEDINIIFGQKGTGKTEILESIKKKCGEMSLQFVDYIGSDKDKDYSRLFKDDDIEIDAAIVGLDSMESQFTYIRNWTDTIPTAISRYVEWIETKDNNKNKSKMKITECDCLELPGLNKKISQDFNRLSEFCNSDFWKIEFDKYLSEEERKDLNMLLLKLIEQVNAAKQSDWENEYITKLVNFSIDSIKATADKCSNTVSKPGKTGFLEFAQNRFELFENAETILRAFKTEQHIEKEYLGTLDEKGDIYIQTAYRMLDNKISRKEEFRVGINQLKRCKQSIENITKNAFGFNISNIILEFQEHKENGITDISAFIGVRREASLENGEFYKPSNGERGILLMQKALSSDSDVYILDEPELGMGNSYVTASIIPKLIGLAKQRKTVIIATHNANIAVRTLPYVSVLRTHKNGLYQTYVGNPFSDVLTNINDGSDMRNWTEESMHTLEGGKIAFYERKDIYESGD